MIEEKFKRDGGGIGVWIGMILLTLWSVFGLLLLFHYGFNLSLAGLWAIIEFMFISVSIPYIISEEYIRTLEFKISEFEVWDKEDMCYVKRFIVTDKTLSAKFIMHKHIKNIEYDTDVLKEINKKSPRTLSYLGWTHASEEDAMKEIYNEIKALIKINKVEEHIPIRNINSLKTYNVLELKEKLNKEINE